MPTVNNNEIKYFLPGPNLALMFSLQVKSDSKPYQVPPRCLAYALQTLLQEELE